MKHYAGLDVSLYETSICIVDETGAYVMEGKVASDPAALDDMLSTAVRYRPDLEAVRTLLAAPEADKSAAIWGGLGPRVQVAGTFEASAPASSAVDTMYRQQRYAATGGFSFSASTFGRIRAAVAETKNCRAGPGPQAGPGPSCRRFGPLGHAYGGKGDPSRRPASRVCRRGVAPDARRLEGRHRADD